MAFSTAVESESDGVDRAIRIMDSSDVCGNCHHFKVGRPLFKRSRYRNCATTQRSVLCTARSPVCAAYQCAEKGKANA